MSQASQLAGLLYWAGFVHALLSQEILVSPGPGFAVGKKVEKNW